MKIVVAEKISSAAIDLFRQDASWNVVTPDQVAKKEQLIPQLKDADALIVRSAVFVDAALLEHADKLRVIGRAGVGVDNIELEAATRKGIAVMNTPGANAIAVAEHTIGLMLALARFIPRATETMHAGKWEKKTLQGTELRGKTLGIIGLGRIGMEVARRAAAFGMTLVAHDPYVSPAAAHDAKIRLADREEVLTSVDYLTLHVGLTPQTANMINATSLAAMKKGVRIVNCARGELIEEASLADAIKSGQVAGAALDVFTEEPPKNSPLTGLPNVILTPHIGGSTAEAQDAVGVQIAHQVRDYLQRGVVQNAVNMPSLTEQEYVSLEPFITFATAKHVAIRWKGMEDFLPFTGQNGVIEPATGDELTQLQRLIDDDVIVGISSPADVLPLQKTQLPRARLAHHQRHGGAIAGLGRIARRHRPFRVKDGLELRQRVQRRVRAHVAAARP